MCSSCALRLLGALRGPAQEGVEHADSVSLVRRCKLNLTCDPSQQPLFILDCGPHGTLNLHKEDNRLIVIFFQMWGDSRYFCNVQGHMFEYFALIFGESNVTVETNDACGRKNYP